jgi:hypothetical protein
MNRHLVIPAHKPGGEVQMKGALAVVEAKRPVTFLAEEMVMMPVVGPLIAGFAGQSHDRQPAVPCQLGQAPIDGGHPQRRDLRLCQSQHLRG